MKRRRFRSTSTGQRLSAEHGIDRSPNRSVPDNTARLPSATTFVAGIPAPSYDRCSLSWACSQKQLREAHRVARIAAVVITCEAHEILNDGAKWLRLVENVGMVTLN